MGKIVQPIYLPSIKIFDSDRKQTKISYSITRLQTTKQTHPYSSINFPGKKIGNN